MHSFGDHLKQRIRLAAVDIVFLNRGTPPHHKMTKKLLRERPDSAKNINRLVYIRQLQSLHQRTQNGRQQFDLQQQQHHHQGQQQGQEQEQLSSTLRLA